MNGKYSQPVEQAVDLIWTSFDRDEIRRGYAMLMQEAQRGDADALAFIARCFMGEQYVWSGAGFKPDKRKRFETDTEKRHVGQRHRCALCRA